MSAASGREEWTERGHASIAKLLVGQGIAGVEHHEDVNLAFGLNFYAQLLYSSPRACNGPHQEPYVWYWHAGS